MPPRRGGRAIDGRQPFARVRRRRRPDRPSGHEYEAVEGPRPEPLCRQTAAELSRIWQRPPGLPGQALVARLTLTIRQPSRQSFLIGVSPLTAGGSIECWTRPLHRKGRERASRPAGVPWRRGVYRRRHRH